MIADRFLHCMTILIRFQRSDTQSPTYHQLYNSGSANRFSPRDAGKGKHTCKRCVVWCFVPVLHTEDLCPGFSLLLSFWYGYFFWRNVDTHTQSHLHAGNILAKAQAHARSADQNWDCPGCVAGCAGRPEIIVEARRLLLGCSFSHSLDFLSGSN